MISLYLAPMLVFALWIAVCPGSLVRTTMLMPKTLLSLVGSKRGYLFNLVAFTTILS
jgi:hypothetical protein